MKQKTIIGIGGTSNLGKSTIVKLLREKILATYKVHETLLIDNGDIKTILEIDEIKIGIESQGDPDSRQGASIEDFITRECDIIICACRSSGKTVHNIKDTIKHGYRLIWATNYRSKQISNTDLNELSAKHLLELFNEILIGKI